MHYEQQELDLLPGNCNFLAAYCSVEVHTSGNGLLTNKNGVTELILAAHAPNRKGMRVLEKLGTIVVVINF